MVTMARRFTLVDDMTGQEGTEKDPVDTIVYAWSGQDYEIDLTKVNADKLEKLLIPYILKSRQITKLRASSVAKPEKANAAREWAKAQGMEVADRGRVPKEIMDAYDARNGNGNAAPAGDSKPNTESPNTADQK